MSVITREEIPQARAAVHPSIKSPQPKKKRSDAEKVMAKMVHEGLLPFFTRMSLPEANALSAFLSDMHEGWGESGALSPIDYNRSRSSGGKGFLPMGIATDAQRRTARVLDALRQFELEILRWLEKSRSRPAGSVTLTVFGREIGNGSVHDRDAAQQGVGIMQMLARAVMATGVYDAALYKRSTDRPRRAA